MAKSAIHTYEHESFHHPHQNECPRRYCQLMSLLALIHPHQVPRPKFHASIPTNSKGQHVPCLHGCVELLLGLLHCLYFCWISDGIVSGTTHKIWSCFTLAGKLWEFWFCVSLPWVLANLRTCKYYPACLSEKTGVYSCHAAHREGNFWQCSARLSSWPPWPLRLLEQWWRKNRHNRASFT